LNGKTIPNGPLGGSRRRVTITSERAQRGEAVPVELVDHLGWHFLYEERWRWHGGNRAFSTSSSRRLEVQSA